MSEEHDQGGQELDEATDESGRGRGGTQRGYTVLMGACVLTSLALIVMGLWMLMSVQSTRLIGAWSDVLGLAVLSVAGLVVLQMWSAWNRAGFAAVLWAGVASAAVIGFGSLWVGHEARRAADQIRQQLSGLAPMFAVEARRHGHERIGLDASERSPEYIELIESQKQWLAANPNVADIYTLRKDERGVWRFIVDSETDYDRNGVYEGEREQRTEIGEEAKAATRYMDRAMKGEAVFQDEPETDRWGTWVSAFVPITRSDGGVEAVLGVDFSASEWTRAVAEARMGAVGYLGVIVTLTIAVAALQVSAKARLRESRAVTDLLRRQAEELKVAKYKAEEASRAKGEFLANMTHEIRTPMTAIIGYVDMLVDPEMPQILRRNHAETIQRNARHLLGLINNILNYSKMESGRMKVEVLESDLKQIVRDAAEIARALAEKKGLFLIEQWEDDVPGTVFTDPTRLREVLVNLLGNAVKYTEEGGVQMTIGVHERDEAGAARSIVLAVRDSGIGLSREQIERLFRPFEQADSTIARRFGGTGLGLVIARRFIELLGGTVKAEGEPGVGSVFTVVVPVDSRGKANLIGCVENAVDEQAREKAAEDAKRRAA
ncbi:MAG: hypothetical protein IBJ18_10745 [Phycisphaerales bacterium]|nr:hypothetical protein [Phycisphaerales bacterium]